MAAVNPLTELVWAPYQEFGIPDDNLQHDEPPKGFVKIMATAYQTRGREDPERIVIYYHTR